MKTFQTIKIQFEAYISVPSTIETEKLKEDFYTKLADKFEMVCTDNTWGLADMNINLELEND
jgi:hypothetical protein